MSILPLIVIVSYASLGWHFWRSRWHGASTRPLLEQTVLPLALLLHGITLGETIMHSNVVGLGVGTALSITLWLSVAIFWLGNFFYPVEGLQPLLLPLAALAVLGAELMPPMHPFLGAELPAFRAHILSAMLAYSLITNAALIALLMNIADRRLHKHTTRSLAANLPPLLSLESLLFKVLAGGFLLLTATLISGLFFSEEIFHQSFRLNHKTLFTVVAWGVFAALLLGRTFLGWRGRIAVRWTLSGFSLLLLAYVGSKFVLEVVLQR